MFSEEALDAVEWPGEMIEDDEEDDEALPAALPPPLTNPAKPVATVVVVARGDAA